MWAFSMVRWKENPAQEICLGREKKIYIDTNMSMSDTCNDIQWRIYVESWDGQMHLPGVLSKHRGSSMFFLFPKELGFSGSQIKRSLLSTSHSPPVQASACLEMWRSTPFPVLPKTGPFLAFSGDGSGVYSRFIAGDSLLSLCRMWRTLIGQRVSREPIDIQSIVFGSSSTDEDWAAVCLLV